MITDPILLPIGVVGVARTEGVDQIAIVTATLVFIPDEKCDGSSRGSPLKHAGENFHGIGFLSLRNVAGCSGFTPVKILLNIFYREGQPGRAPIDHTADRRPVALAKRGDGEDSTQRIAGHGAGHASLLDEIQFDP